MVASFYVYSVDEQVHDILEQEMCGFEVELHVSCQPVAPLFSLEPLLSAWSTSFQPGAPLFSLEHLQLARSTSFQPIWPSLRPVHVQLFSSWWTLLCEGW